ASQWLHDGDEVRVLGTRIRVLWGDGRRSLQVRHLPKEAPVLLVPAAWGRPGTEAEILVRPVEYEPRYLPSGVPRRAGWRPPLRVVAVTLLGLLAAGFLFAARLVEVQVTPDPERL